MPKIIAIGNMKGGVGKTTTAVNLAQHLGRKGKTLLLDADEELQCSVVWRDSGFDGWTFEARPFSDYEPADAEGVEYIIIDTKGNEQGHDLLSLAQQSDLLLIPTKADGLSATGLIRTLTPLLEAGVTNYRVVIVANTGGRGEELRDALAEQDVPVLTTIVRHSTAVGDAAERRVPLEGLKGNRYAKLLSLEYGSVMREVLASA